MVETAIHKTSGWLVALTSEVLAIYVSYKEFCDGEPLAEIYTTSERIHRKYCGVSSPEGRCGASILHEIHTAITGWHSLFRTYGAPSSLREPWAAGYSSNPQDPRNRR